MNERIERLKNFLKESPHDNFLNHALALEYIKIGDDYSARQCFELNLNNNSAYVATYYHLGKLLERATENEAAIAMYEKGMAVAKAAGDNHSYNELQNAYEDLAY